MSLAILFILLFPYYLAHQLLLPINFFFFIIGTSVAYGKIPSASWKGHNKILREISEQEKMASSESLTISMEELINAKFVEGKVFTKPSITLFEVAGLSSKEFTPAMEKGIFDQLGEAKISNVEFVKSNEVDFTAPVNSKEVSR